MRRWGIALLLAAAGCGGAKSTRHLKPEICAPPEAWRGVTSVAVMPPDNWTTEIGLEYITWYRALVNDLLRERGYQAVPVVEVNRFMLKNKFMFAGELRQYTFQELTGAFRVDALLFWNITAQVPKLEIFLVKADGTDLWASGEVRLGLKYNAITKGRYSGHDKEFALTLAEVLRRLPVKS